MCVCLGDCNAACFEVRSELARAGRAVGPMDRKDGEVLIESESIREVLTGERSSQEGGPHNSTEFAGASTVCLVPCSYFFGSCGYERALTYGYGKLSWAAQ